jgi:hypothetical protein
MTNEIELANKCVLLHTLLEASQELLDDLKGTNIYRHALKQTANAFSLELDEKIKTWYSRHVPVKVATKEEEKEEEKKSVPQITFLKVSKDLSEAMNALIKACPTTYKVIPAFIEALEKGEVEINPPALPAVGKA